MASFDLDLVAITALAKYFKKLGSHWKLPLIGVVGVDWLTTRQVKPIFDWSD
jgi:hypothetical protein